MAFGVFIKFHHEYFLTYNAAFTDLRKYKYLIKTKGMIVRQKGKKLMESNHSDRSCSET